MSDSYFTIANEATCEIKVKGSRFIGHCFYVDNIDSALVKLNEIHKKEFSATHNCYAYLVGLDEKQRQFKYSDDGEPSGTAGKPIYDVLKGSDIVNALIVVTRYYGGTKLGTGGLVRAYGGCGKEVLSKAGKVERFITDRLKFEIEFSLYNPLLKIVERLKAKQINADFSDTVAMEIEIRKSMTTALKNEITELTSGKVAFDG